MFDLLIAGGVAVMPASTEAADIGVQGGATTLFDFALCLPEVPLRQSIEAIPDAIRTRPAV